MIRSLTTVVLMFGGIFGIMAGENTGSAYLGSDVLWRPREWLTFNLLDEHGGGFTAMFTVRDMNTYVQAPAPVMFEVVGPSGKILVREMLPDDGIVGGNSKNQDGIYDPFADFRYRQWHRVNSPGGYPVGKERSPYLTNPEKLPFRTVVIKVPDAGKGLYRVAVCGRWDHWISLTPDRPMKAGIHPGAGPLYVSGAVLKESYFYVPSTTKDIRLGLSEEIQPYQTGMTLSDSTGKELKSVKAQGFFTWLDYTPEKKDAVYRLDLNVATTGVCLHAQGFPLLLCPDAATAAAIHGGIKIDAKGRSSLHEPVRVLDRWADSLTPADLTVDVALTPAQEQAKIVFKQGSNEIKTTYKAIAAILPQQNLETGSPEFGKLSGKTGEYDNADLLALAAGFEAKDNPFYGNSGLIRRVLLARLADLRKLDSAFRFDGCEWPVAKPEKIKNFFDLPSRSNWYGLGLDADHSQSLLLIRDVATKALPLDVVDAWKDIYRLWAGSRWNMHAGEVANQWGWNMSVLDCIRKITNDADFEPMIRRHIAMVTAPKLFGRLNPDETPFDRNGSSGGYDHRDVDCGLTASGYMPEQLGFDGEYTCEQTLLWGRIWREYQAPSIVAWFNTFNYLKTHLTMPVGSAVPEICFNGTCSPTDLNFRTRYMTHKNHQPPELVGVVDYLDLWFPTKGKSAQKPWPCLDRAPFIRSIDNKFFFVRRGDYYAVIYAGPRQPNWSNWSAVQPAGDGSFNFAGPDGPGYGGWGMSANKPGGISALWLTGAGPMLFGQNHTVGDSDTVWGRAKQPLFAVWRAEDVDPTEFAACYGQSDAAFDTAAGVYRLAENVPGTPLNVSRTYRFDDRGIAVTVAIKSNVEFAAAELYYSLPLYAVRRDLTAIAADGHRLPVKLPEPVLTPSRPRFPDAKLEHNRGLLPSFSARGLTLSSDEGPGIDIAFDREFTCRPLQPFRYRKEMPAAGGVLLSLPLHFNAGEVYEFNYRINTVNAKIRK